MQARVLLGLSVSSQRPGSGQVTRRCCSPPPQASEHWKGQAGRGLGCGQSLRPPPPRPGLSRPHLPPGRGVPAEAGLQPTGTAHRRHGRPRLAVEGPQRPQVPHVHTLHVPHGGPPATAAGALQAGVWGERTPCPNPERAGQEPGQPPRARVDGDEQGRGGVNATPRERAAGSNGLTAGPSNPGKGEEAAGRAPGRRHRAPLPQPAQARGPHTLLQFPVRQAAQGLRWQRRAGWGRPAGGQSSSRPELQRTDLQTAPRPQVVEH